MSIDRIYETLETIQECLLLKEGQKDITEVLTKAYHLELLRFGLYGYNGLGEKAKVLYGNWLRSYYAGERPTPLRTDYDS